MKELYAALAKAQGLFPAIPKDKTVKKKGRSKTGNDFEYSYKYSDLTTIIDSVRPSLSANGLGFIQGVVYENNNPSISTTLFHSSGESIATIYPIIFGDGDAQQFGGAVTYAKRYSLTAILGISADEDLDNNENQKEQFQQSPKVIKTKEPASPAPLERSHPEASKPPSDAQLKRLHAIAGSSGWTQVQIKDFMQLSYKVASSKDLSRIQYDEFCSILSSSKYDEAVFKLQTGPEK